MHLHRLNQQNLNYLEQKLKFQPGLGKPSHSSESKEKCVTNMTTKITKKQIEITIMKRVLLDRHWMKISHMSFNPMYLLCNILFRLRPFLWFANVSKIIFSLFVMFSGVLWWGILQQISYTISNERFFLFFVIPSLGCSFKAASYCSNKPENLRNSFDTSFKCPYHNEKWDLSRGLVVFNGYSTKYLASCAFLIIFWKRYGAFLVIL